MDWFSGASTARRRVQPFFFANPQGRECRSHAILIFLGREQVRWSQDSVA